MKKALALVAVAGIAGVASAQSATVTVTANGGAAASVNPGDTVSLAARVSWTNALSFAGLSGANTVQGNAGTGSNFASPINPGATVNFGTFTGGSRTGVDIAFLPPFFVGGTPVAPSGVSPMTLMTYDVVINDPGTYTVQWTPNAAAPNVRLFTSATTPGFVEAQTTYVGAVITVVPAPASLALVGLGGLVAGRRRR